jgi:hypothetical protein
VQFTTAETQDAMKDSAIDTLNILGDKGGRKDNTAVAAASISKAEKKPPHKFSEEEQRAVGRVAWSVWETYIRACGSAWYWALFVLVFLVAALAPLVENGWLGYWSRGDDSKSAMFYLSIYASVSLFS